MTTVESMGVSFVFDGFDVIDRRRQDRLLSVPFRTPATPTGSLGIGGPANATDR